jgi:hypothetical protein
MVLHRQFQRQHPAMKIVTPRLARRLALTRQRLAGPRPASLLEVGRDLGCLQLDPLSVVARSHQLVLWSRAGAYEMAALDNLLWQERRFFEYWAHCASIVLTEDYPLHYRMMRAYPGDGSAWNIRVGEWVRANQPLKRYLLAQVRKHGPVLSRDLEDEQQPPKGWVSTGWTSGRNVSGMLDYLWLSGQIMVAGRQGIQKVWDLAERCLPEWTPRDKLSARQAVRLAAQKSLRALGVGTARHIERHFTRGRYPGLEQVLAELEAEGVIQPVAIQDGRTAPAWPGPWYIHTEDLPLLDQLADGAWQPRTTLLSPFDNLICDRQRTGQLFNFDFRIEIYTPKAKRRYGYYVLPILHEDQLIGRLDPEMDRSAGQLSIHAVHAEPEAPQTRKVARAIAGAVEGLAAFLGARKIVYNKARVPTAWKRDLLA